MSLPSWRPRHGFGLGQPFDHMLGMPEWVGDSIRLLVHGTATYLGLYVGAKEKGFLSALGYGFGVVNGIGAFMDLISILEIMGDVEVRQGDTA